LFPTDNEEFWILYAAYIGLFLFLLAGTIFSKKKVFRNNLIFFLGYTLIMIFVFLDKDNFKYGSSLVVLFYGAIFIVLHLIIFLLSRIYIYFSNRKDLDLTKHNRTTEQ